MLSAHPIVARLRKPAALTAILLFVFLLYLPCIKYGFVWDDVRQILFNPRLTAWSYVPGYFTSDVWAHEPSLSHHYYRPLFLVWLRLCSAILGTPREIWHLPSILAHVAVTLCVFLLLQKLVSDFKAAALGAALFAIHPIQSETVAWISASGDLLLTIFFTLSVYFFVVRKHQVSWISVALATAAMFTKESGVTVAAVIFVYEWLHTRFKDAALHTSPYFASALLFLAFRGSALENSGRATTPNMPLSAVILGWPRMLAEYVLHLVWPVHLSPVYAAPAEPAFWPFPLFIIAIAALIWVLLKCSQNVQFGAAWFVITLAPTLILPYVVNDYIHNRYLYLPSIGLVIIAADGLARLRFTALRSVTAAAVALTLCWATCLALPVWKDNVALFSRAIETAPDSPEVMVSLASAYMKVHREADAYPLFKKLVERYPDLPVSNYDMGRYYLQIGDRSQAEYYFAIGDRLAGK